MRSTLHCLWVVLLFGAVGCQRGKSGQESSAGAKQVEVIFKFPTNSEGHTVAQQAILDRLKVTTDPAKILWIHLIALDGKIVRRMPVVSKVMSSDNRLEPVQANGGSQHGYSLPKYQGYGTSEIMRPEGIFGNSDSYIYWFDPQHRYHQWGTAGGLGYLLTDYPIDLQNPMDEITGMYNMSKAAHDWQVRQEAGLKNKK